MHFAIVDRDLAGLVTPGERVLHPLLVIALGIVFAGMGTAAFFPVGSRIHGDGGLSDEVVEFEGFEKIGIPDHAAVFHVDARSLLVDFLNGVDTVLQNVTGAEHRAIVLHTLLHFQAQLGDGLVAGCVAQAVQALKMLVGRAFWQFRLGRPGFGGRAAALTGRAAEHNKVDQGVGTETVCAMYGHTGRFANSHQAWHHGVRIAILLGQHFTVIIGRDAAHIVVNGWQNRDRLFRDVDACEDFRGLGDARQARRQHICAEMLKVQVDVVFLCANAATFADFHRHRAGDNIAGGEVFCGWGITLHEALTFGIGQVSAFAAGAFGDQAAGPVDAGWVELNEFHVLQRQAGAQHHGVAVARTCVGRGTREEGTSVSASCQDNLLRAEPVKRAVIQFPCRDTAAGAFFIHDQVEREILDEEFGLFLDALAIQRVQHGVPGPVSRSAGTLHGALAEFAGHAAEGALVDLAFIGPGEGHSPMLQLVNSGGRFTAEIFNRVLVAQPVRPFDGVVHVPAPVILTHIAERGSDAALCGNRVGARWENFGDTGGFQAGLCGAQGSTEARAASAHNHDIICMVDPGVIAHLVASPAGSRRPRQSRV